MANFPTETHRFPSFDGVELAWTAMGQGRDAMLIHGYASTA
ncbi:alpha/beta hydrolase, partial [Escherichia coli]|nr:alpha/beta hydrolase [Escherichia coli]